MSEIAFQNGFLCGMATKGMIKSGASYKPILWNEELTYFYIDFKRSLMSFSLGMLKESIIVHDSAELAITDFEFVAPGVYKFFADISNRPNGVTVLNKYTTLLKYSNGLKVPEFSAHFYVSGTTTFMKYAYAFEETSFPIQFDCEEKSPNFSFWDQHKEEVILEETVFNSYVFAKVEEGPIGISYWEV